jgi:hypothetical protein
VKTPGTKTKSRQQACALAIGLILVALPQVPARAAFAAEPDHGYQRPGVNSLISVSQVTGMASLLGSRNPTIRGDARYVAFESNSPDLVLGDTNLIYDIFVRDRVTATTERVSVNSLGQESMDSPPANEDFLNSGSKDASISASGRFIAFVSTATNLVFDDRNEVSDIFVHDRKKGTTMRASVSSTGEEGNDKSIRPHISADGRYVAYQSEASNLAPNDKNGFAQDVFMYDLKTKQTVLVSNGVDSGQNGFPSATGSFVAFEANSAVFDPIHGGIFVKNMKTGERRRVHVGRGNSPGGGNVFGLSSDARYLSFAGVYAGNYVPNDTTNAPLTYSESFTYDLKTGRTEKQSVTSYGEKRDGRVYERDLSANGRFVVMGTQNKNLGATTDPPGCGTFTGDTEENARCSQSIWLHDRAMGSTEEISLTADGQSAGGASAGNLDPAISASGRYVVWSSLDPRIADASALPAAGVVQIYMRDRGPTLGVGGFGGSPPPSSCRKLLDQCLPPPICVGDLCIPPGALTSSSDRPSDTTPELLRAGADLTGISVAYRLYEEDLFAAIELEHMPTVLPGLSPIFYGLRFEIEDKSYEVRATSLLGGTFGLFDCTNSPTCTKVADLRGGYGTTGMRVVFSLPLAEIGLKDGGELSDVEAFSAVGSAVTGAQRVLDRVSLSKS